MDRGDYRRVEHPGRAHRAALPRHRPPRSEAVERVPRRTPGSSCWTSGSHDRGSRSPASMLTMTQAGITSSARLATWRPSNGPSQRRIRAAICSRPARCSFEMLTGSPAFPRQRPGAGLPQHHVEPSAGRSPDRRSRRRSTWSSIARSKSARRSLSDGRCDGAGAASRAVTLVNDSGSRPSPVRRDDAADRRCRSGCCARIPIWISSRSAFPTRCELAGRYPVARRPLDAGRRRYASGASDRSQGDRHRARRRRGAHRHAAARRRSGPRERAADRGARPARCCGRRRSRRRCAICSTCRTSWRERSSSRCRFRCRAARSGGSTSRLPASARAYEFYLRANQVSHDPRDALRRRGVVSIGPRRGSASTRRPGPSSGVSIVSWRSTACRRRHRELQTRRRSVSAGAAAESRPERRAQSVYELRSRIAGPRERGDGAAAHPRRSPPPIPRSSPASSLPAGSAVCSTHHWPPIVRRGGSTRRFARA